QLVSGKRSEYFAYKLCPIRWPASFLAPESRTRFGLLVGSVYRQWRRQVNLAFKDDGLSDATRAPLPDHGLTTYSPTPHAVPHTPRDSRFAALAATPTPVSAIPLPGATIAPSAPFLCRPVSVPSPC